MLDALASNAVFAHVTLSFVTLRPLPQVGIYAPASLLVQEGCVHEFREKTVAEGAESSVLPWNCRSASDDESIPCEFRYGASVRNSAGCDLT
jgi:hypothetical protein